MSNIRINLFKKGDFITPIEEAIHSNNSFFHDKKDKEFTVVNVRDVDLEYAGFQFITIKDKSVIEGEFYASAFKKVDK